MRSIFCSGNGRRLAGIIVAGFLPFFAGGLQAGTIFPNPIYDLQAQSAFILSYDLNGDGRPDLVAAEGGRIAITLGLPDGQLGAPIILDSPGGSVFTVAVGDFNADGIPDLAQASNGTALGRPGANVFLGEGGGRFHVALPVDIGGFQNDSTATGDFNGDGKDDLIVESSSLGTIWLALSRGDGTFDPPAIVATGIFGQALAVADFNGDGKADLAAADTLAAPPARPSDLGFVRIFPGLGDGTFGPPASTGVGIFPMSLAVADLNRDSHPDLAVANYLSGSVSVLLGSGDGSFTPQALPTVSAAAAVAAADLDGDHIPDLAICAVNLLVARGRGDGTFDTPVESPSWGTATDLAVGDFDGDTRPDLVVLNSASSIALLFANGDGTYGSQRRVTMGSPNGLDLNVADFDGDGIPDLARSDNRVILVRPGLGNGDFSPDLLFTLTTDPFYLPPNAVGDFNDDGQYDLITFGGTPGISVHPGNGDGHFAEPINFLLTGTVQSVAIADLDGDGKLDLAVATYNPEALNILKGLGDGTFTLASTLSLGFGPGFLGMTSGDFNGDHALDLVIVPTLPPLPPTPFPPPSPANIYVLFGHGDGTFRSPSPVEAAVLPKWPVAADFNGDGIADLAVSDTYAPFGVSRGVSVLISRGDSTFAPPSWNRVYPAPGFLVAADFDGDGKEDLAAGRVGRLDIALLIGQGDGTFRPSLDFGGAFEAQNLATGDFDSDGRPDLAVADYVYPAAGASILLNRLTGQEHGPDAATGGDHRAECGSLPGGATPLDASPSTDADSSPGTNDDIVGFEWFEMTGGPAPRFLGRGEILGAALAPGDHPVHLVVTDRLGETDAEDFILTVADTTPPDISVSVSPSSLWPPNHLLIPVHATVLSADRCGEVSVVLESITSSEPDDAPGGSDGNTIHDIQGADPGTPDFDFLLRAERIFPGPGRTYQITYRATDTFGNTSRATASVLVPANPQSSALRGYRSQWVHSSGAGGSPAPPWPIRPR
jgi:VCBS repeat protein